jgi:hypothetical protein
VDPLADTSQVTAALDRGLKGQSVRSDQLRSIAERHTPTAIARAAREGAAQVEQLGCSAATAAKIASLSPEAVRTIEEAPQLDRIHVEVNLATDAADPIWQSVSDVSPGQRAMALLALALSCGDEPLIIDQPEDDLDNRYIYDEVVTVLKAVCERRQVIVATHNANIPVLGDAELIVAFDADGQRSQILASGGLDEPDVAEWARRILEGGEAAFQARHRRYEASGGP